MTLHRFFVPPETLLSADNTVRETVCMDGEQAHQVRRVLRLRAGHRVVLLTGDLREWIVRLTDVGPDTVKAAVEEEKRSVAEPRLALTLYQSVLKGPKFELVIQRCTEVGITAFAQVRTERSIPPERADTRTARYRSIIREAAEQSERGRLPELEPSEMAFGDAVRAACARGPAVVLWEDEDAVHLRDLGGMENNERAGLFVGPEGGFTGAEVEVARTEGAHVVSLGPRVLRSETAAIVGSALLLAQAGDIG